jgi:transaldolase
LKLFLDTAHLDHIRTVHEWGILDGVTTNPTLAAREGLAFPDLIARICDITPGPVSAEVVAPDVEGMLAQARQLSAIADNVVVKVPMSKEGVSAGARMVEEGIGINVTLVFSVAQAILAARIGATFVSPFLGRVDDAGNDGLGLLRPRCWPPACAIPPTWSNLPGWGRMPPPCPSPSWKCSSTIP